jgi:UDP-N-acetylmuramate--alanine ligase
MNDSTFFCGIGGSGMLPARLHRPRRGARVAGSDRSLDAGRLAPKFDFLRSLGHRAVPAGRQRPAAPGMILVTSAAVEETCRTWCARELGLRT